MKIKLSGTYSGVAILPHVIYPGEYELNDPALHGIGTYLVENGMVTVIEEVSPLSVEISDEVINEVPEPETPPEKPLKPPKRGSK